MLFMKKINNKKLLNELTPLSEDQIEKFENEGNYIPEKKLTLPVIKGCRCMQIVHKKNMAKDERDI